MRTDFIEIKANAKLNFTLDVLGRREDGYHELRSVVVPVAFSDVLKITEANEFSSDTGYDDDLCLKASRAFMAACKKSLPFKALRFEVKKEIPAGGGLGGGSADAAAVLLVMNQLSGNKFSLRELVEIAAKVGSDVPALVCAQTQGPVLMEGRGEKVSPLLGEDVRSKRPAYNIVIVNPGIFSSTPEVFRNFKKTKTDDVFTGFDEFKSAYMSGDASFLSRFLKNDLEIPAVSLYPEIEKAKILLRTLDVCGTLMSGSGSTVFALTDSEENAVSCAQKMTAAGYFALATKTL